MEVILLKNEIYAQIEELTKEQLVLLRDFVGILPRQQKVKKKVATKPDNLNGEKTTVSNGKVKNGVAVAAENGHTSDSDALIENRMNAIYEI
jgi:hypothetical protein